MLIYLILNILHIYIVEYGVWYRIRYFIKIDGQSRKWKTDVWEEILWEWGHCKSKEFKGGKIYVMSTGINIVYNVKNFSANLTYKDI